MKFVWKKIGTVRFEKNMLWVDLNRMFLGIERMGYRVYFSTWGYFGIYEKKEVDKNGKNN
tara:strand:+ start:573 stop:752 length:180 start_codon:yes stop_codon:yes gene_type:complete